MAIKTYVENGVVKYSVAVKSRSRLDRKIQPQRSETGELKGLTPEEYEATGVPELMQRKLQRIEMRLYGDTRAEVVVLESAGITWKALVDRWIDEAIGDEDELKMLGIGMRSANGYIQALQDHTDGWYKLHASQITAADFERLILQMRKMGYSNSTIYNVKSAINSVFKWAIKRRMVRNVTVPPTYGCEISRKNSRRPEILNFSQICTLLEEAEKRKHPWFPIWKGVLYTGFRSGEAYALRRRDLSREENRIIFDLKYNFETRIEEQLKDHEWRQVPINAELDRLFEEMGVWNLAPDEYVFERIQAWKNGEAARHLRAFCEEIGVPSICFHTLRACWATQLLRNGVAQTKVMIMGGWADLETMQAYLRRAGVEIEGATDSLNFSRQKERPARVFKLISQGGALENEEDSD